jgi:hypothetical protein
MLGGRKLVGLLMCAALLFFFMVPAFAGDRDMTTQDLHGVPKLRAHRYAFAVIGGAAVGAGLGWLLPGGNTSVAKGALVGGGAMSTFYLMSHRNAAAGWRDWAFIGSNTALGTGLGWTLCGCDTGAVAGALFGGGGTAAWRAMGGAGGVRAAANTAATDAKQDVNTVTH